MLRKAAAAGTVAWVAPTVLSSQVSAGAVGACTPKCVPQGTPRFTPSFQTSCRSQTYTVTVTIAVDPASVSCPCGGLPQVTSSPVVVTRPKGFRGEVTTDSFTVTVVCDDNSNDPCPIECQGTVSFEIVGNNGNDCARNRIVDASADFTC